MQAAQDKSGPSWGIWAAVIAVSSIYPFALALGYQNTINDDAFITLTYARCLAEGKGFVFGFPPASLGTTAPLFAGILAFLMRVLPFTAPETLLLLASAFFWSAGAWVLFLFRRAFRLAGWEACAVGVIYLAGGLPEFMGMETNFYCFLGLLAIGLFGSGWYFSAGIAAAALALARTEGMILLPILGAWLGAAALYARAPLRSTARNGAMLLAGAALLWLPWAAYAYATFGHVLPQTGEVKVLQGMAPGRVLFGADLLPYLFRFRGNSGYPYWLHYGVALLGIAALLRRGGAWLLLLGWLAAYTAGFTLARVAMYPWYAAPVQYGLNLAAGLGIVWALGALLKRNINPRAVAGLAVPLVAAFALVLGWQSANLALREDNTNHFPQRWRAYKAAAFWLREHTPEGSTFACLDVGYLGYYSHNRILDLSGLVTPEQLPWLRKGDKTGLFYQELPEYCMFWKAQTRHDNLVVQDPRFAATYEARASFPISDAVLTIYQRR